MTYGGDDGLVTVSCENPASRFQKVGLAVEAPRCLVHLRGSPPLLLRACCCCGEQTPKEGVEV